VVLDADGEPRMLNVEKGRWHSLECLESGSVLFDCKDGGYRALGEDEIMFGLHDARRTVAKEIPGSEGLHRD
jgi:hypothetical protein